MLKAESRSNVCFKNYFGANGFLCLILLSFCISVLITAQPRLLLVEGNIGVGKSTFLNMLSHSLPNAVIISEPCDEWQDIAGHNLLEAFYKDSGRWALSMQFYVLMTAVRKLQRSIRPDCDLYIMERSLYTSKYCFAKNLQLMGMMNPLEWALYNDVWDWYNKQAMQPSAIIYLRADPEVCYERMKIRARSEEGIVPLAYLQMLHDRHDEWLMSSQHDGDRSFPILVLDATCNFRDDSAVQKMFMCQILDFLQNQENTIFTI